jgi:hypothetical protein
VRVLHTEGMQLMAFLIVVPWFAGALWVASRIGWTTLRQDAGDFPSQASRLRAFSARA